ncbi:hypothetical protein QQP08_007478 [Theobroma cacao]|nr:hypothetical protein QQP08_007478 [Theobroma cacao]
MDEGKENKILHYRGFDEKVTIDVIVHPELVSVSKMEKGACFFLQNFIQLRSRCQLTIQDDPGSLKLSSRTKASSSNFTIHISL